MPHDNKSYVLYGTPFSLYTGKAKAVLRAKGIPFSEVFSSLKVYRNIIIPKTGVSFIPVLQTPQGEFIQDTAAMVDLLEERHPAHSLIPATPRQKLFSYLFELFVDEWLVMPAMHYRWNHDNAPKIYQEFGSAVLPKAPAFLRGFLGKRLSTRFRRFLPPLGVTPKMHKPIEDWFENEILASLEKQLSDTPYLLGGVPTLADCALMGPLYAHMLRDEGSGKRIRAKAPHVDAWANQMQKERPQGGELLPDDQIPEALLPIIECIFSMQWPVLEASITALKNWKEEGNERIPRTMGNVEFSIHGVTEVRKIMSFNQWKLQRVLDCYGSFDEEQTAAVNDFLVNTGGYVAMQIAIPAPVERKNNRLAFVAVKAPVKQT